MTIPQLYKEYLKTPRISTDTRKDLTDTIFFCLKGPNFDANGFAKQAIDKGASLVISDDIENSNSEGIIIVNDVLQTLQELAHHHRNQFNFPVIGLTGSNGKTTNKELIATVLKTKYKTHATKGNLNNHIGVPLTLLECPLETEIAIIEMGANHQREIAQLSEIAAPDYGMITNIGKAHLEGFGGIEGVKKGKKELFDFLKPRGGKVFVNADDEVLMSLSRDNERIQFGSGGEVFVKGKLIASNPSIKFEFSDSQGSSGEIQTQMVGEYNYYNLLAAVCIGRFFDVDYSDIKTALEAYLPTNNRSQILNTGKNQILLDAYNANPTSMKAALQNFVSMNANQKIAMLGQMMELGEASKEEHQQLINLADKLKIEVILVGDNFNECDKRGFQHFNDTAHLKSYLKSNPIENHLILLKGSRTVAMEKVVEAL
jgi:UDP-N-acetylmuramoyl-tripeptide--D-alanyl-D-alanine ligase